MNRIISLDLVERTKSEVTSMKLKHHEIDHAITHPVCNEDAYAIAFKVVAVHGMFRV